MTKDQLMSQIATRADCTKAEATKLFNAAFIEISEAMAQGYEVAVPNFGKFVVKTRPERKGRNPKTGNEITIAASKAPAFKPGKTLKELLNV